ncbi:MAG: hypothetical protein GX256_05300 [Fretibacterium sp.]|nr:hypothetical protein [Fretibacterium sp.]
MADREKDNMDGTRERKRKPSLQGTQPSEGTFVAQYDVTSKERYVDSTSQKTDFDRVLDELTGIAKETAEWDVLRWTKKHFNGTEEERQRKLESYYGALIVHAAQKLYDAGLTTSAFQKLEQASSVLEAKDKLAAEVEAIKARSDNSFDVSDMLGLFD